MCSKKRGSLWLLLTTCAMTAFKPAAGYDIPGMSGAQIATTGNYRIYHKSSYRIVDTAGFYLYYRYVQFQQIPGKGLVKKDEYYFSKDGSSDIELLTIENLKKAYPENNRFHYDIDAHFRSDRELMAYDSFTKSYKLKYLYLQSLKG